MNKKTKTIGFILIFAGIFIFCSIAHVPSENKSEGNNKISTDGKPHISKFDAKSHKAGKSCNECHSEVQVCGTVYDSTLKRVVPNVVVKFSTAPDTSEQIVATLEVDKSGNFYTTNKINVKGLYPLVAYPDVNKARYMQSPVNSGDCNSCHKQGNRIYIK